MPAPLPRRQALMSLLKDPEGEWNWQMLLWLILLGCRFGAQFLYSARLPGNARIRGRDCCAGAARPDVP